jgi:hypothetical protein
MNGHSPRLPNHAPAPAGADHSQESTPALGSLPPLGPETAPVSWTRFLDKMGRQWADLRP